MANRKKWDSARYRLVFYHNFEKGIEKLFVDTFVDAHAGELKTCIRPTFEEMCDAYWWVFVLFLISKSHLSCAYAKKAFFVAVKKFQS